jgi:hypothetical protein
MRRYRDTGSAVPHVVNAGKYLAGLLFTASLLADSAINHHREAGPGPGPAPTWPLLRMLWVALGCVQTVYALAYDVIMDWGLVAGRGPGRWRWRLRENTIYPRPVYFCAAVANAGLRCAWLSRLLVYPAWIGGTHTSASQTYTFVIALLELTRRFIWNFIRVENGVPPV